MLYFHFYNLFLSAILTPVRAILHLDKCSKVAEMISPSPPALRDRFCTPSRATLSKFKGHRISGGFLHHGGEPPIKKLEDFNEELYDEP